MNTQKLLSLGFGAAAFAGVLGGGAVLAQGGNPASALTSGVANVVQQVNPNGSDTRKAEQDAYLTSLAQRLGVSVDTLKTALKDTSLEKLAQMVTDGKLTQAQADQIKTEIESGDHIFFGAGGFGMKGDRGGHDGPGGVMGIRDDAALATFLGIDQATLRTELQSGKTLATVATDHGKTRDQLKAFLTDQLTKDLAQKVTDGKITQAQADQMKTQMTSNLDGMIDGTFQGRGHGDGHRGPGGPGGMNPNGSAPQGASSTSGTGA